MTWSRVASSRSSSLFWCAARQSRLGPACLRTHSSASGRQLHITAARLATDSRPFRRDDRGRLLSRVNGPQEPALLRASLHQHWVELVKRYGSNNALVSKHEPASQHLPPDDDRWTQSDADCLSWTYNDLNDHIDRLARGLQHRLKVGKGDRVAVLMGNSSAYLALQWALAKVGAIMVPFNPAYAPRELGRSLAHVGAKALVMVPSLKNANYVDHLQQILPGLSDKASGRDRKLNAELLPHLDSIVLFDNLTEPPGRDRRRTSLMSRDGWKFSDAMSVLNGWAVDYRSLLIKPHDAEIEPEKVDFKDVINLQLTSGTTGLPKAVALTSYGMLNNGIAIGNVLHLREDDIVCNNPPLFHCFGLTLGNIAAQTHGACLLYAAESFDPKLCLKAVTEEKATAMHGVPAMFFAIKDELDKASGTYDVSSLRTGLISGASIPVELMSRLLSEIVPGLTSVYGQTETSPVSFGCDAISTSVERKAQTVGRVFPHVSAKIVHPVSSAHAAGDAKDEETAMSARGTPLPVNTPGELCTAGYLLMDGYYNDPERTREVMSEHEDEAGIVWMRTGDMAVMDEEGWVKIVGRCKDVIIRGGENLFPATITNCVEEVHGVGQAAVVSVPHERLGETVGVFIRRAQGPDGDSVRREGIREHVLQRLSHQNAPEYVWFLGENGLDTEFPKTASGKVQNVVLRDWARSLQQDNVGRIKSARR
ncbi:hypothetical protein OC861_003087 [Tilletia horrida]|nr:hypothetical protein OC861_003087 [Tilletia horrida]